MRLVNALDVSASTYGMLLIAALVAGVPKPTGESATWLTAAFGLWALCGAAFTYKVACAVCDPYCPVGSAIYLTLYGIPASLAGPFGFFIAKLAEARMEPD